MHSYTCHIAFIKATLCLYSLYITGSPVQCHPLSLIFSVHSSNGSSSQRSSSSETADRKEARLFEHSHRDGPRSTEVAHANNAQVMAREAAAFARLVTTVE